MIHGYCRYGIFSHLRYPQKVMTIACAFCRHENIENVTITSLKVNSVFSSRTRVKSNYFDFNNFRNIKSVLFLEGFHSLNYQKLSKSGQINLFFTKPEKI